ncbi:hypothetical protein MNB_SV-4-379 [hydrothermal vent metagenome]|uniref:MOSC domain-containing protein n=1 Tax=hydrothermal vent metagenome TaxID=652676 RepID=A0A1W1E8P4_9ZZZZ
MKKVGKVCALFTLDKEIKAPYRQTLLTLDCQGIHDDKHYGSMMERTVLISSTESYTLIKEKIGILIPYGYLGKNLLIDFNPCNLPLGTQLKIGDTLLEIMQNCTLYNHLSTLNKRIPKLLKDDRGIFAKVVQLGHIHQEDTIFLLDTAS